MVKIDAVRESNLKVKEISDLVTVFLGGTGGIGESTAKELFLRSTRPRAYIIGRSVDRGNRLINELQEIQPAGTAYFIQKDVSTIRAVDELCAELREREPKIHCLVLTAGFMTLKGRSETAEGIDSKMAVNYYTRMRCILNLMPALTRASEANELSRVITVLAAGSEGDVREDDLGLKHNFTLHACLAHCVVMSDFFLEELAKRCPQTSFSHSYPGTVKTGIANQLSGPVRLAVKLMYAVMTPWILNVQESGERHLFQMTSQCYPSRNAGVGIPIPEGLSVMIGSDGTRGSGAYLLDWDGKSTGDTDMLEKHRGKDMGTKTWNHTMAMFQQAEARSRKDSKRPSNGEDGGAGRSIPDPPGWRPGRM
ncbi:hypothetical protein DOTSEDRAFT_45432 [Dothistroma septosporum NZE10]|uniref:Uncharacterized protein n=1 Tax=Dothistroma septosporum (strain NZE10 / CBS 128990) TaxID=675120 RepID=M2Y5L7_DOTSN|nr:hypothetical protein DOTSEDRAFT_45432 [Dothistroma septosporum NZE10]